MGDSDDEYYWEPTPTASSSSKESHQAATAPANLTNVLADILKPALLPPRKQFECTICFSKFLSDDGEFVCHSLQTSSEATEEVSHSVCVDCLRGYAKAAVSDAPLADGAVGLPCVSGDCKKGFLYSEIAIFLPEDIQLALIQRMQREAIVSAELPNLTTCVCGYQICLEGKVKYFLCAGCRRRRCRYCPRIYNSIHEGKTCEEMDRRDDEAIRYRNIGNQLNEAVVRVCHRCGVQTMKSDGCNKMTCRCRATYCYLCREKDIDYLHFCQCENRKDYVGPCPTCKKTCNLFENDAEYDNNILQQIEAEHR